MKRITKIGANETPVQKKKLKVAAYCRVSTENEDQKELLQDAVMTPRYRQLTEDAASGGSTKTLRLRFRSLEALEKLTS